MASITQFRPLLQELADGLFAVVFPTRCSLCGGEVANFNGLGVCRRCWSDVRPWQGVACERCGLPIVSERAADSVHVLCGHCRAAPPSFDRARAYGIFKDHLRLLILQLKFRRRERLGKRLGGYLALSWRQLGVEAEEEPPLIVPVPLFHARQKERGFNQAKLLAAGLRHRLETPANCKKPRIASGVLVRTRPTLPQVGLKLQARMENVRGAFAVTHATSVRNRAVVLIDDVMTTGATLAACSGALKQAGANKVFALALARATPQFPDSGDVMQ